MTKRINSIGGSFREQALEGRLRRTEAQRDALVAALELALDPKGADWMAVAQDAISLATGKEG